MTTTTYETGPSRVELELSMRAAVLAASPREHGRERARRTTRSLTVGLVSVAGLVALYDVAILAAA